MEGHDVDRTEDAMIRLDRLSKRYPDGTVAVHELTLDVPRGALVALVGPSGCGKTTTMKMVNRLIEPTSGTIWMDGRNVTQTNPVELRRGIGYVIQSVGLFPHRTVLDNVAVVPELLGWGKDKRRSRARELLEMVGLDPDVHGRRYPHELSGGQRQRIGVARALAADPPVLLMDEPFSAVDPVVRDQLQEEFLRLQAEVKKTILFVTHDIEEAVRLGDKIAVFAQGGYLQQYDTPATILGAPATPFVAEFVGADRGLKRLSVTPVDESDVTYPPVVRASASVDDARRLLAEAGSRWAVVLDDGGGLAGWVGQETLTGDGTVGERAKRMNAWVKLGDSLKLAFSEMLTWDAGWIAVLDSSEQRYLGVLTPSTLHRALRRSIDADEKGVQPSDVRIETVLEA